MEKPRTGRRMQPQHSSGDLLADRRYRYAEGCLAEADFAAAADLAEQVLDLTPRYAAAWLLLGRARVALFRTTGAPEQRAGALAAFAAALAIDPDDELGAGAHRAGLGTSADDPAPMPDPSPTPSPALSPAYLRALFDGYAPRFERHLVEGLGYVGPALMRDALPPHPERFPRAFDLGCGTGLVGAAVRDRVSHLTGIDLSPAMLAQARAKGCYDRLVAGDIDAVLAAEPPACADLCLAADVFIYMADLARTLLGIARVLRPGGLAAFTVQSPVRQAQAGDGSVLGPDGRYAHGDGRVRGAGAAAGLGIQALVPAAVRREGGGPVPGRVVVLRKG